MQKDGLRKIIRPILIVVLVLVFLWMIFSIISLNSSQQYNFTLDATTNSALRATKALNSDLTHCLDTYGGFYNVDTKNEYSVCYQKAINDYATKRDDWRKFCTTLYANVVANYGTHVCSFD